MIYYLSIDNIAATLTGWWWLHFESHPFSRHNRGNSGALQLSSAPVS